MAGAGCVKSPALTPAGGVPPASAPQPLSQPVLEVKDQAVINDQVVVERVVSAASVWVAIHRMAGNQAGEAVGQLLVSAGETKTFAVPVQKSKITDELTAMLHTDRGVVGTWEFPGADAPVAGPDGKPVMVKFRIIKSPVPAGASSRDQARQVKLEAKLDAIAEAATASPAPVVIMMEAKQWEFVPAIVRVKKGARVQLKIKSVDVNHGLGLPEFNVRAQLAVGKTTTVSFTADQTGSFPFFCTVYCGEKHGEMRGMLIVEE